MTIPITTNLKAYFRQMLELIRSMPPLDNLTDRDLDVLSIYLYYDYIYKDIEESLRQKLVFDYDVKVKIMEQLNIKEYSLNNSLTILRRKGILKGRALISRYGINPENPDIHIKFTIEDVKKD